MTSTKISYKCGCASRARHVLVRHRDIRDEIAAQGSFIFTRIAVFR
jgi:hypothetical protein